MPPALGGDHRRLAVAALFLTQILSSSHAAKYGDGPHEHAGQICVLSLANPSGDIFTGAATVAVVVVVGFLSAEIRTPRRIRVAAVQQFAAPRGPIEGSLPVP